jgi:intracellular septation protein A
VYKIIISASILLITSRIQVALMPYKDNDNNRIELFAITTCLITVISYLVYFEDESVGFLNESITVLLILMNAVFLMEWLYKFTF